MSYSHINPQKNISASTRYLKPFEFRIVCLSSLIILLVFIFPNPVFPAEERSTNEEEWQIIAANPAVFDDENLPEDPEDIFDKSLAELADLPIITVSKKPESLHKAASAIYVLTQEDIRRSGAVNIMEALRMVPGVLVSKINQNRYVVSIRGFNRRLGSDKLLVLMDGRSVYSPVASGVFWIGQDTVLEDIERIEVIRGPGAALWGSNAVAGVINIITKNAGKTQGGLVAGGVGTEERGFGTLRYGGKLKNGLNYRVYGKYRDRDDGVAANKSNSFDDKQIGQGGFRTDWQVNKQDNLTIQGDYYRLNSDLDFTTRFISLTTPAIPFQGTNVQEGANFLTRWTRTFDDASSYQLQVYYDRLKRKSGVPFDNVVDQFDIDFQHNLSIADVHNFSWGLNYRYAFFDLETTSIIQNNKDETHLASLFFHDEIQLIPKELSLILGTKVEYNVFTGFEFQPSVRTAWNPHPNHTLWGAFSRAVRLPTVSDENITVNRTMLFPPDVPFPTGFLVQQIPNSGTKAEELLAYELGYRAKINKRLNFDITAFYFDYDDLLEVNIANPFFANPNPPFNFGQLVINDNSVAGEVYGVELSGQWQARGNWRLLGSYTFTHVDLRPLPGSTIDPFVLNSFGELEAEGEPQHIFNVRSYLNLPNNFEFDTFFYYVSRNRSRSIPAYSRLDLRLGWKPTKKVDLSFVVQNLFDDSHPELNELLEVSSETQRSFYVKATLNF